MREKIAVIAWMVVIGVVGCSSNDCIEPVSNEAQIETAHITYENGYEFLTVGDRTVATRTQGWSDILDSLGYELVPCGCWQDGIAEVMRTE